MTVCLSFAGAGGNFPFHIGASKQLHKLIISQRPTTQIIYAGISSGSVVASMLALGFSHQKIVQHFYDFSQFFDRPYKNTLSHWFINMRRIYHSILGAEAYRKVNGRLFIGYSVLTLTGLQFKLISHYTSNEDLVEAICTSCHIMPYSHFPTVMYRGEICCDGAFSQSLIRLPGVVTLGVSASMIHSYAFWSDWLLDFEPSKIERLLDSGEMFVVRNEHYYLDLLAGRTAAKLRLCSLRDTLRRFKYGVFFFWMWYFWRSGGGLFLFYRLRSLLLMQSVKFSLTSMK